MLLYKKLLLMTFGTTLVERGIKSVAVEINRGTNAPTISYI